MSNTLRAQQIEQAAQAAYRANLQRGATRLVDQCWEGFEAHLDSEGACAANEQHELELELALRQGMGMAAPSAWRG